jgi:hypothetical protein
MNVLEEGDEISRTMYTGSMYKDNLTFTFTNQLEDEFNTTFKSQIAVIESAAISFVGSCPGHVGLAPKSSNSEIGINFME